MKNVVLGQVIEIKYELVPHYTYLDNGKKCFTSKPFIATSKSVIDWVELCSFDGDIRYNTHKKDAWNGIFYPEYLNIDVEEEVQITDVIFRADLSEVQLRTDKIVESRTLFKEETEQEYEKLVKEFNKTMIESNEKLLSYCKVHKINPEETDVYELINVTCQNQYVNIENGEMVIYDNNPMVSTCKTNVSNININNSLCDAID